MKGRRISMPKHTGVRNAKNRTQHTNQKLQTQENTTRAHNELLEKLLRE